MANVIADFLFTAERPITVSIFLYDRFGSMQPIDFIDFFEAFSALAPRLSRYAIDSSANVGGADVQKVRESARRSQHKGKHQLQRDISLLRAESVRLKEVSRSAVGEAEEQEIQNELEAIKSQIQELTAVASKLADRSLKVFYSYAHEDEKLCGQLRKHLRSLTREGIVTEWFDREISAGASWDEEISDNLAAADIILLLISVDFLNSDYVWEKELPNALEQSARGDAVVIPIILRSCDWQTTAVGRAKLQALPKDAKPVSDWSDVDKAFLNVALGIRTAIEKMNER